MRTNGSVVVQEDKKSRPATGGFFFGHLLRAVVEAPWARAELRDQQRSAEHGHVLHEHDHLHLLHHWIGDTPERVHQRRNGNQEQGDERGPNLCAIADEDREAAEKREDAREWHCDRSQGHALRRGESNGLALKVVRRGHEEDEGKEEAGEKRHRRSDCRGPGRRMRMRERRSCGCHGVLLEGILRSVRRALETAIPAFRTLDEGANFLVTINNYRFFTKQALYSNLVSR